MCIRLGLEVEEEERLGERYWPGPVSGMGISDQWTENSGWATAHCTDYLFHTDIDSFA